MILKQYADDIQVTEVEMKFLISLLIEYFEENL
jgi:hypothetical protein